MDRILCLLFVFGAVCAALSLLGVLADMIPERVYDYILSAFFGIEEAKEEESTEGKERAA